MSQISHLEQLYNQRVKVDESLQKDYQGLLKYVMDTVIARMKQSSPAFNALYRETYYGGSFFDGLKVNSAEQEFDLNIVFKWKDKDLQVADIGTDPKKKNFCYLDVTKPSLTPMEEKIVDTGTGSVQNLSPIKMFELVKSSVDRALTSLGLEVTYEGRRYRVTRHEYAPVTLDIRAVDGTRRCEVDLVPSLKMDLGVLAGEEALEARVTGLCDRYNVSRQTRGCMAISLHRADKHRFELDFHDVERKILYNRGCVKKVVKLMKYLRDLKGGAMAKLWSHLLKVRKMEFKK